VTRQDTFTERGATSKGLYSQIKAGKGALIGNAGEYFVVGELLRRGVVAALAPRNAPDFDVIATSGSGAINIRVKTKTAAGAFWRWNVKKDGSIFSNIRESDVTVLVELNDGESPVDYFIVPTSLLDDRLKANFDGWVLLPGRAGRPHNPENTIRGVGSDPGDDEWLEPYRGNWSLILSALEATN